MSSAWAMHPRTLDGFAFFSKVPALLFGHLRRWRIPAVPNAPLHAATQVLPKFPVYMFSHGLGGSPEAYAAHAIELASHGFVVCLPHHHDGSAAWRFDAQGQFELFWRLPPQRLEEEGPRIRREQVQQRSREMVAAYDHLVEQVPLLQGRLDTAKGYFIGGHSFGGATAMETAQHDPRVIAAAIADIWMHPLGDDKAENKVPLVWLDIQSEQWRAWQGNWKDSRRLNPTSTLLVQGSRHGNFSDFSLISDLLLRSLRIIGPGNPRLILQQYHTAVLRFFSSMEGSR